MQLKSDYNRAEVFSVPLFERKFVPFLKHTKDRFASRNVIMKSLVFNHWLTSNRLCAVRPIHMCHIGQHNKCTVLPVDMYTYAYTCVFSHGCAYG